MQEIDGEHAVDITAQRSEVICECILYREKKVEKNSQAAHWCTHVQNSKQTYKCRHQGHVFEVSFWQYTFDWRAKVIDGIACSRDLIMNI